VRRSRCVLLPEVSLPLGRLRRPPTFLDDGARDVGLRTMAYHCQRVPPIRNPRRWGVHFVGRPIPRAQPSAPAGVDDVEGAEGVEPPPRRRRGGRRRPRGLQPGPCWTSPGCSLRRRKKNAAGRCPTIPPPPTLSHLKEGGGTEAGKKKPPKARGLPSPEAKPCPRRPRRGRGDGEEVGGEGCLEARRIQPQPLPHTGPGAAPVTRNPRPPPGGWVRGRQFGG